MLKLLERKKGRNDGEAKRENGDGNGGREWPRDQDVLLEFGTERGKGRAANRWLLRDAFEGVQVFGGTGSGKSSGSGKALAKAYLNAGMGGLVLTAKKDELNEWINLAVETGRLDDVISFSPENEFRFNFMEYELKREGAEAGKTENLVNLFCSVLEVAERKGGGGSGNDSYWQRTLKQLLRNAFDLAIISVDEVDLATIFKIITSAAKSRIQFDDEKWQSESICSLLLREGEEKEKTEQQKADFELVKAYWESEFPSLAEDTRSVIVSTFTSMADCFLRGTLRELFCTDLNLTPEDTFEGKIVVLHIPVKEWNELGQFAQALYKFVWQRAVERRVDPMMSREEKEEKIRPVFLWADESHFFANSQDAQFQSTARSSRCCTVYLTQNLPSYILAFGGSNAKLSAEAFIGNLQTKIFHANGDPTTNLWAADSISRSRQMQFYGGLSHGTGMAGKSSDNQNAGGSLVMEYSVPPREYTLLRTGGPDYEFLVDGIIFQPGRSWMADSKIQNFIHHEFQQLS